MLGRTAIRFVTAADRRELRYGLALLSVLVALAARIAAVLVTDVPLNFPTFFVAVLVAAMVGGLGPGFLALGLSAGIAWRFWMSADGSWLLHTRESVQLGMFVLCGGLIVVLVEAMRIAVRAGLAAEERFRSVQEVSLDAFVILEPVREAGKVVDFRWTYANPMADTMRPMGTSSLVGRRVLDVFPDETGRDMVQRMVRLLENGGPDDIDVRRVIDGEERWIRSSGVRLGGDLAVTFRDVTQERRAAAALRSSEELFRGVANSAPVLIWATSARGQADWFNQAWLNFRGRTLEQELGEGWLSGVHPEDRESGLGAADAAADRREPFNVAFRLRRADGAWRWINSVGAPRFDESGGYRGYIGSCFDFTETVEARKDLEDRVAERTAALQASMAETARAQAALAQAQRLETVGRLTGGVAHDFNNLLTVIVGGLDMILRRPDDTTRVKRLAEAALAAGQRGERLTRQLLAFSRNQELKLEVVDVGALLDQAEPLLRRAAGEAMTLTIRRDDAGVRSRVDAAQFEAALLNLVVNASDATATGGEISIAVEPVTLAAGQVLDTAPGRYVRVAVSDTGAGMPPEVLARVFEPFFTTKEVGKGTGLGLAQVYGFLRQCGGGVSIDSAEGRGTSVALYLPATDAPATFAAARTDANPPGRLEGVRVLLVEDDAAVREIAGGLLRDLGCAVTTAENGVSAIEALEEGAPFDLLMSDIIMPGGVSGVDLARSASAHRPDMAVLLTTGYAGDRMDVAPADLPWPVLRKPFQVDQLAEMASALLADRETAAAGQPGVSAAGDR
ncbi:ATP-binding protein [Caulobacter sp. RL271]|uniref:histidine kinase n=1 Tax=Caulobacter segnis TaxID=88688 RepID=A0ABY4ZSP6_9CAUL|nr:ATP-binding protein [Caulobacter segnis]USQ95843.1 PAS domain S-box protein [Caulobacter segnis]